MLFKANPKYKKFYNAIKKKDTKLTSAELKAVKFEREFLAQLIDNFFKLLNSIPLKGKLMSIS